MNGLRQHEIDTPKAAEHQFQSRAHNPESWMVVPPTHRSKLTDNILFVRAVHTISRPLCLEGYMCILIVSEKTKTIFIVVRLGIPLAL